MKTPHKHAAKVTRDYSYRGPIADARRPNPAAGGNITRIEVCDCGAARSLNVNTRELEAGPWTANTG